MKNSKTSRILFYTLLILSMAALAVYANLSKERKLLPFGPASFDHFGRSVCVDGNAIIVGDPYDDDRAVDSGSAYIYRADGSNWAKLVAYDGAPRDYFGRTVSISGGYAIVGACWDDDKGDKSGSAYIYRLNGTSWTYQSKLTATDGEAGDIFGVSVAISGQFAIVGACWDDDKGTNAGAAYIFRLAGSQWIQQAKLTASDGQPADFFGYSVSISGNSAIVGARFHDDSATDSGSAYIFSFNGADWIEQAKLTAFDAATYDRFGSSVSIGGEYAIVGSAWDDDVGVDSGSAYIFKFDGSKWLLQNKLTAFDGTHYDFFGWAVSICRDYAIVSADGDDDKGLDSGSAYIFKNTGSGWLLHAKITSTEGKANDWFGISASISIDYAVVGAYLDDDNGSNSGSAFIYSLIDINNIPAN